MGKLTSYKVMAQKILKECENYLGVYRTLQDSTTLELLPIEKFVQSFKELWKDITPEEFKKVKSSSSYNLSSLSYTDAICNYYREPVLDLSGHVRVDLLANLLVPFLKRDEVTDKTEENINSIIKYLKLLENNDARYIKAMSYRYIRLFVCFFLISDLSDCSVIANFIIQQAFISGGVDNGVKEHLQDILSIKKQVDDLYERYSKHAPATNQTISKKVSKSDKVVDPKNSNQDDSLLTKAYQESKVNEEKEEIVSASSSFSRK